MGMVWKLCKSYCSMLLFTFMVTERIYCSFCIMNQSSNNGALRCHMSILHRIFFLQPITNTLSNTITWPLPHLERQWRFQTTLTMLKQILKVLIKVSLLKNRHLYFLFVLIALLDKGSLDFNSGDFKQIWTATVTKPKWFSFQHFNEIPHYEHIIGF